MTPARSIIDELRTGFGWMAAVGSVVLAAFLVVDFELIRKDIRGPVSVDAIQHAVAEFFSMSVDDLLSAKRTSDLALARQIAMFLCRKLTEVSLQQIGLSFRKKDHTTVLHAHRKISQMVKEQPRIRQIVDTIEGKL